MKPKLHPEERRWFKSTEYPVAWLTLLSIGYAAFYGVVFRRFPLHVSPEIFLAAVYSVATAYLWGRVLWKKNRGHFYSGFLTSEFQMWLIKFGVSWSLYLTCGLSPLWFLGSIAWAAAHYCIGRGFTKSIGTRTVMTMVHR